MEKCIRGGWHCMKKLILITLCFVTVIALVGCTQNSSEVYVANTEEKNIVEIEENYQEEQIEEVSENGIFEPYLPADSATINSYIESCKALLEQEEVTGIINYDNPIVLYQTLPENGYYSLVDDYYSVQTSEEGYCYSVTFNTVSDDILGPIVFYVDVAGTVVGAAYRE